MITEDYVSFQIAKLLKEKDFDKDVLITDWWYDEKGDMYKHQNYSYSGAPVYYKETCYHAPTLQMVTKWLREVYKLYIEIGVSIDLLGNPHFNYSIVNKDGKYFREGYTSFEWEYEKACEEAIRYCLENLI